jgi:hypothetical protein
MRCDVLGRFDAPQLLKQSQARHGGFQMDLGTLRENLKQLRRRLLKSIMENANYDDSQLARLADVQSAIEAVSAQIAAEGLTIE